MFAVRVTVMTALLLAGVLYIFLLSFPHSCRDSQQIIVQVAEDHDINSFGHTVVRFYIIFLKVSTCGKQRSERREEALSYRLMD